MLIPTRPSTNILDMLDEMTLEMENSYSPTSSTEMQEATDAPLVGELVILAEGEIDPRVKLLSHSSRLTLHKCPRKYQLYRRSAQQITIDDEKEVEQGVTFAYGKAVGVGIQSVLEGKTKQQILLDMFLTWDVDLLDENPKQKKSFWEAIFAINNFINIAAAYLNDYELVMYEGKPAVELSFQITLPDGFRYRGYVDAVLRHKSTGAILVLECKTTSGTPNSAMFKNSGQAIGYSIVLDILFPELSSYTVLYLVYATKSREYVPFNFAKSLLQRALWLQELILDTYKITMYEEHEVYPTHGESCFNFYRECEYLGLCHLDISRFSKPLTTGLLQKIEEESKSFQFTVDFYDLVAHQLKKGEL